MNGSNNENHNNNVDLMMKLIAMIKKIPPFVYPILGYIALTVAIIVGVLILILAATGVAEGLADDVGDFGEKLGNLFTFKGWNSDYEIVQEQEKKYYEKLDEIKEKYKEEYGVNINTTLITATLFYGTTMGDYLVDSEDRGEDVSPEVSLKDQADLYKMARSQVDTLARYMLVKTTTNNSCGATSSSTTNPETPKEIAEAKPEGDQSVFKPISEKTTNNVVAYTDDPKEPGSCPYEDDAPKYINKYKNSADYQRLVTANTNLNNFMNKVDCTDPDNAIRCEQAQRVYTNAFNNYYSKWKELGIRDSDPGNTSSNIAFDCPYNQVSQPDYNNWTDTYNGCSELPSKTVRYSVDDQYEGVYYYKLMTPFKNFWIFETDDNFITKYYGKYVYAEDPEVQKQNVIDTVDGIYELYYQIVGREGTYSAPGDYAEWKQCGAPWSNISIGGTTVCQIGCALTSLAIQVARSGTATNLPDFNPGTFIEKMKEIGGIDRSGAISSWAAVTQIAPNFYFDGRGEFPSGQAAAIEAAKSLIDQGYYLVVQVKRPEEGTHFVAIDRIEGNTVYMFDPASNAVDLYGKYSGMYNYRAFYKTD